MVLPDNPRISPEKQELRGLRKRLKDAELERDILKKAIAIFSKGDGGTAAKVVDVKKG